MSVRHARQNESGFALMDAMVALAILGVVLGLFFEVIQTTMAARRHAAASRGAVLVAQSQLALAQAGGSMPGAGQSGALRWRTTVEPYPGQANGRGLEQVSVTVTDSVSGRAQVALSTLRLAR